MQTVKWGVLGTAKIATSMVIPAIKKAVNAEVVAIASLSGKAKNVAERLGIPKAYDSYEDLLNDANVDAVYIPLPNHLHYEWVLKAAEKEKHILCEKPLALNQHEAEEMFKVCEEHHIFLMEAFMYQFHPQHKRVRDIIASGEIGDLQLMRSSFSFFMEDMESNIRMDPKKGGGSIYDIGCYCIHSTRMILGSEPKEINVIADIEPKYGVDVSALGYMAFEDNIKAVFDCSFRMAFRDEYEVVGSKGRILVPFAYRPDQNNNEGVIIIEKDGERREEKLTVPQYIAEIEHFSESIIENKSPIYTSEATLKNTSVIEMFYKKIYN